MHSPLSEILVVSFAAVLADLEEMFQTYLRRPDRVPLPPAKDPLQLTEADIRSWDLSSRRNPPLLTEADIQKWSLSTGLKRSELYDRIAIYLARSFHRSKLNFGFCDEIVNEIHGIIVGTNEDRPDLCWQVFLAFDAGESYPGNDRSRGPVATYTRPQIAKLVEQYSHEYPDL